MFHISGLLKSNERASYDFLFVLPFFLKSDKTKILFYKYIYNRLISSMIILYLPPAAHPQDSNSYTKEITGEISKQE